MDDLLLKDFEPRWSLAREEHLLTRARFPAVDIHNHFGPKTDAFGDPRARGAIGWEGDLERLIETMDQLNVRVMNNLTGRWGDQLKRSIDRFEGRYPGRFVTFANPDWTGVEEPGFGEKLAADFEESVRAGARGLKIFKALGLRVKDASGRYLMPDDERLDPLWAKAGELGVPVMIHVADPAAFFKPADRHNEFYLWLERSPDWKFHGKGYPDFLDLVRAGIRMMGRHPRTTFIAAHTGWYSENLKFVGEEMLDKLPNVYADFSARLYTMGVQPYSSREFFLKYQDRLLFGSDTTPSLESFQPYFRFLETADECFPAGRSQSWLYIYGINLPDEVLEKVYHKNAERLLPSLA